MIVFCHFLTLYFLNTKYFIIFVNKQKLYKPLSIFLLWSSQVKAARTAIKTAAKVFILNKFLFLFSFLMEFLTDRTKKLGDVSNQELSKICDNLAGRASLGEPPRVRSREGERRRPVSTLPSLNGDQLASQGGNGQSYSVKRLGEWGRFKWNAATNVASGFYCVIPPNLPRSWSSTGARGLAREIPAKSQDTEELTCRSFGT